MDARPLLRSAEIPAKGGGWIAVDRGECVRIIDVEGAQIADTFAVARGDLSEHLSARHTRAAARRIFPKLGEAFFSDRMRPMLTFVADTSPGAHDMLWMSCNRQLYRQLGASDDHANCQDNFLAAAADAGWRPERTPDPVNFFQNTCVREDGRLVTERALSRPGDYVALRAELDVILVVTACAFDLAPINGDRCTGLRLEVDAGSVDPRPS
jgi:uncharacterized protein YcgI (DUF1989 family)